MRLNELTRPKSFVQGITSECKQILSLYASFPGRYFYRGTKKSESYYRATSPQNRIPKDTSPEAHAVAISAMIALGFTAHRGNSIFVTPSRNIAKEFTLSRPVGQIYIIFPVDGFHYAWSPNVNDFYSDVRARAARDRIDSADFEFSGGDEDMREVFEDLDYKDTDLDRALKFSDMSEVMIHGSYYAVNSTYERQVNAFIQGLK